MDIKSINNDVNGNPRRVVHWLAFETDTFSEALNLARNVGGKSYRGKDFGGGIVFQAYDDDDVKSLVKRAIDSKVEEE